MTSLVAISTVAVMDERLGIASRILRWWRSLPILVVDGVLAAVVLAVSLIEVGANNRSGELAPWQTALLVGMSLVIIVRRRYPIAVWLASGAMVTIYGIGEFPDPTLPYGPLIAVYTVAAHTRARTAARAGVITLTVVAAGLIIDPHDDMLDWLVAMLSVTTA